jgi:hypothetical protein
MLAFVWEQMKLCFKLYSTLEILNSPLSLCCPYLTLVDDEMDKKNIIVGLRQIILV